MDRKIEVKCKKWKGLLSGISSFSFVELSRMAAEEAEKEYGQDNQGDDNVSMIPLAREGDNGEDDPGHGSRDQEQDAAIVAFVSDTKLLVKVNRIIFHALTVQRMDC